jgi:hypothetical protein
MPYNSHQQSAHAFASQPFQPYQPPSQQISPLSTSTSASPTSPKSYHGRQVRPLYMPAVLRPTEHSSRASSNKPEDLDEIERVQSSNSSFVRLGGLSALGRLSRRSTGDSGKCMDGDWNLDLFPKPTAQPTREHWKVSSSATLLIGLYMNANARGERQPDQRSAMCDEPTCTRHFTYWTRRHHCRRCGNIFCDNHSLFNIPLDQDANYNPKGTISRACSHCYEEFQVWRSRTNSQASSEDSSIIRMAQTAPSSPLGATPTACGAPDSSQKAKTIEIAASVPRDWNWSTF